MHADLLLVNGNFWTGNPQQPHAQTIAIAGNKIVAVGDRESSAVANSATLRKDLNGRLTVPGFNDAHVHFYMGGDSLTGVDLRSATNPKMFADTIAGFAFGQKKGKWILNGNWNDQNWTPPQLPTHEMIDHVTPEHPVFVHRSDGHMSLANHLAMQMAGITRETADVSGGEIVRDASGQPTGIFKDNAKSLIERVIPPPSPEYIIESLRAAQLYAVKNGVTSIHDMGVLGKRGGDTMVVVIRSYQELVRRGELRVRVSSHLPLPEWKRLADVGVMMGFGNDKLRIGAVKSFSDGSLGSTTAWFFDPYTDAPHSCGLPSSEMADTEVMYRNLREADTAGLQLTIHAIGDRANHTVLDLLQRLEEEHGKRDRRWRIEHAQHLQPADIKRFAKLGVIASVQPYHLVQDGKWAEHRIGPERARFAYAFRSLLDAGAKLALGSDWWVAPMNPLLTIHAAVTRNLPATSSDSSWMPEQRISVSEALYAHTMGGAWASGEENIKGSIEPGKLADLAVLSKDIFNVDPAEIRNTQVDLTVFDGRIVFERQTD